MLSIMETQLGLMIVGPNGKSLRISRTNPAFAASKDVVNLAMPWEQSWEKLQELSTNPLKAFSDWLAIFGLEFSNVDADSFRINDSKLSKAHWLPLLQKTQAVAGTPVPVMRLHAKLKKDVPDGTVQVSNECIHWAYSAVSGYEPYLIRKVMLPVDARRGDLVDAGSRGGTLFLVSYSDFKAKINVEGSEGTLEFGSGVVLQKPSSETEADAILLEPVIIGNNRTYKCEEGDRAGWLEDLSFDNLIAARINIKAIRDSGSEARIINRISNAVVA